jgi:hypothetical protein
MLCQQAGIGPSGPDIHEPHVSGRHDGKSESSSKNLTAAFPLGAIEGEDVHLYLMIRRK